MRMNGKQRKKLVAPCIITGLLVAYYVGFAIVCAKLPEMSLGAKLICGLLPLALASVCVYVLIERIKEIRSGEEDDLSQY